MWATLHSDLLAQLPRQSANGVPAGPAAVKRRDWDDRLRDLDRYRTYTDDWDGQGAAGIGGGLIDSAVALAAALRRHGVVAPDSALPGVQGTVGFEWDLEGGGSAELEVLDPGTAELFVHSPGEPMKHMTFTEVVTA